MTCKEFSSMIPAFMEDTLDNDSLRIFLNHLDSCRGCREELEIQYLVTRFLTRWMPERKSTFQKIFPNILKKKRSFSIRERGCPSQLLSSRAPQ